LGEDAEASGRVLGRSAACIVEMRRKRSEEKERERETATKLTFENDRRFVRRQESVEPPSLRAPGKNVNALRRTRHQVVEGKPTKIRKRQNSFSPSLRASLAGRNDYTEA
jgi:hypothetical protein